MVVLRLTLSPTSLLEPAAAKSKAAMKRPQPKAPKPKRSGHPSTTPLRGPLPALSAAMQGAFISRMDAAILTEPYCNLDTCLKRSSEGRWRCQILGFRAHGHLLQQKPFGGTGTKKSLQVHSTSEGGSQITEVMVRVLMSMLRSSTQPALPPKSRDPTRCGWESEKHV